MTRKHVTRMESCMACGLTNSGAVKSNPEIEADAQDLIILAKACGNQKVLIDLAARHLDRVGVFTTCGKAGAGQRSIYVLRRARIAQAAMAALIEMLEPVADNVYPD